MKPWVAVVAALVIVAVAAVGGLLLQQGGPTGTLVIGVTDAPLSNSNVTHIYLTISDITLQGNSTATYKVNSTTFDLLRLTNVTKLLGPNKVPVGEYTMIRFTVVSATATIGGANVTLTVPSGEVKVPLTNQKIEIKSGMTTTVLIDITVDKANISASKNLSPVVHIVSVTAPH